MLSNKPVQHTRHHWKLYF